MSTSNAGYLFYNKMFLPKRDGTLDKSTLETYANELINYELTNYVAFNDFNGNSFELTSLYPGFASGLGENHDVGNYEKNFKLGLLFDHTTGLPYLSGASIKGKVKEPFSRVLHAGEEGSSYEEYSPDMVLAYFKTLFEEIGLDKSLATKENIVALREEMFEGNVKQKSLPMYKRDIFLDAYIVKADHLNNYRIFSDDYITQHASPIKNPNPIRFLRVRSNVTMAFRFDLKDSQAIEELKKEEKEKMIKRIIMREKLGARTALGYGKFRE